MKTLTLKILYHVLDLLKIAETQLIVIYKRNSFTNVSELKEEEIKEIQKHILELNNMRKRILEVINSRGIGLS